MAAGEKSSARRFARVAVAMAAVLCVACGGGPKPADWADTDPEPNAGRPNPDVANPCAAPAIDPALNPCLGAAGLGDAPAAAPSAPAAPTP